MKIAIDKLKKAGHEVVEVDYQEGFSKLIEIFSRYENSILNSL